jgi:prepilin-type N-terminal cleavage/methylation domain-containing protein
MTAHPIPHPHAKLKPGFTLIEIVVAATIILVLSGVIVPSLLEYLDQKRIEDTAALLAQVRDGITDKTDGHFAKVAINPGRVSMLVNRPTANNAAIDDNSCAALVTAAQQTAWDNNAPFVNFLIPRTGLPTPIGTAEDTLNRVPNSANVGVSRIVFKTVDLTDVTALDTYVDGGDGAATGAIRWNVSPLVMFYVIPLNNKC